VTSRRPRSPTTGGEWLGGRRWTGYGAVVVVAIVCVATLLWWQGSRAGSTRPSSAGVLPTAGAIRPQQAPAANDDDQTVPTTAPEDVTWQVWHAVALPYSASAGPSRVDGQVASGFAHTPRGALMAMVQASCRTTAATDPGWRDVIVTMDAPGPGRDARIAVRSKIIFTAEPAPGSFTQIAGFQFISYTPADAVIQLVSKNPDQSLGVVTDRVTWRDGDWKLVLASAGGDATSKQSVASLNGFVPWGAV
jgi:hypothetical protein